MNKNKTQLSKRVVVAFKRRVDEEIKHCCIWLRRNKSQNPFTTASSPFLNLHYNLQNLITSFSKDVRLLDKDRIIALTDVGRDVTRIKCNHIALWIYKRIINLVENVETQCVEIFEQYIHCRMQTTVLQTEKITSSDPNLLLSTNRSVILRNLEELRNVCTLIVQSKHCHKMTWMIYNATIHIYDHCMLLRSSSSSCSEIVRVYLGWCIMTIELFPALLATKYLPWRITLYATIGDENALNIARAKVQELRQLEHLQLPVPTNIIQILDAADKLIDDHMLKQDEQAHTRTTLDEAIAFIRALMQGSSQNDDSEATVSRIINALICICTSECVVDPVFWCRCGLWLCEFCNDVSICIDTLKTLLSTVYIWRDRLQQHIDPYHHTLACLQALLMKQYIKLRLKHTRSIKTVRKEDCGHDLYMHAILDIQSKSTNRALKALEECSRWEESNRAYGYEYVHIKLPKGMTNRTIKDEDICFMSISGQISGVAGLHVLHPIKDEHGTICLGPLRPCMKYRFTINVHTNDGEIIPELSQGIDIITIAPSPLPLLYGWLNTRDLIDSYVIVETPPPTAWRRKLQLPSLNAAILYETPIEMIAQLKDILCVDNNDIASLMLALQLSKMISDDSCNDVMKRILHYVMNNNMGDCASQVLLSIFCAQKQPNTHVCYRMIKEYHDRNEHDLLRYCFSVFIGDDNYEFASYIYKKDYPMYKNEGKILLQNTWHNNNNNDDEWTPPKKYRHDYELYGPSVLFHHDNIELPISNENARIYKQTREQEEALNLNAYHMFTVFDEPIMSNNWSWIFNVQVYDEEFLSFHANMMSQTYENDDEQHHVVTPNDLDMFVEILGNYAKVRPKCIWNMFYKNHINPMDLALLHRMNTNILPLLENVLLDYSDDEQQLRIWVYLAWFYLNEWSKLETITPKNLIPFCMYAQKQIFKRVSTERTQLEHNLHKINKYWDRKSNAIIEQREKRRSQRGKLEEEKKLNELRVEYHRRRDTIQNDLKPCVEEYKEVEERLSVLEANVLSPSVPEYARFLRFKLLMLNETTTHSFKDVVDMHEKAGLYHELGDLYRYYRNDEANAVKSWMNVCDKDGIACVKIGTDFVQSRELLTKPLKSLVLYRPIYDEPLRFVSYENDMFINSKVFMQACELILKHPNENDIDSTLSLPLLSLYHHPKSPNDKWFYRVIILAQHGHMILASKALNLIYNNDDMIYDEYASLHDSETNAAYLKRLRPYYNSDGDDDINDENVHQNEQKKSTKKKKKKKKNTTTTKKHKNPHVINNNSELEHRALHTFINVAKHGVGTACLHDNDSIDAYKKRHEINFQDKVCYYTPLQKYIDEVAHVYGYECALQLQMTKAKRCELRWKLSVQYHEKHDSNDSFKHLWDLVREFDDNEYIGKIIPYCEDGSRLQALAVVKATTPNTSIVLPSLDSIKNIEHALESILTHDISKKQQSVVCCTWWVNEMEAIVVMKDKVRSTLYLQHKNRFDSHDDVVDVIEGRSNTCEFGNNDDASVLLEWEMVLKHQGYRSTNNELIQAIQTRINE